MIKPRLFVGSSKESLSIAYAVQENLDNDAEVTVWDQGVFDLSSYTLEQLLSELEEFDFGLFIFAPDDITKIRGKERKTVRDNVIFELGLFVGRLGRERCFVLIPKGELRPDLPSDLFGLNVAEFNPQRRNGRLKAALGPACNTIRQKLYKIQKVSLHRLPAGVRLVRKDEFTKVLIERLSDDKVKTIRIVTYTSEVDAGLLTQFHVSGEKEIEIYKRSILSELVEEQEYNIQMISAGSMGKPWNKAKISIEVSDRLMSYVPPGSNITQYLYDGPPAKRVYLFDDNEAILSYYEVLEDANEGPGSIYRGMGKGEAMYISLDTPFTQRLLEETHHHILRLQRFSRSWTEERRILFERGAWQGHGRRPCIKPRAVFLDLDGVLYDSLPHYITAWKEAFAMEHIDFPEINVYQEEGRGGKETIRKFLHEIAFNSITEELVDRIHKKKNGVLVRLGPPKPQQGATELAKAIATTKLPIFVVTGSSNEEHINRLQILFDGLIKKDFVIKGQDVHTGKPNPEPYSLACIRAEIHPHEAIVIENAPLGIQSADAAGTFCIAVNTGPLDNNLLLSCGARAVFDSCNKLAERWEDILSVLKYDS